MPESLAQNYLADARQIFLEYQQLGEAAFGQISDDEFFKTIDSESNSIAVNMKHMAGNMLSRWSNFLTTDGEKPERDRDAEFIILSGTTRAEIIAYWEKGWACLFRAIDSLRPDDLMRTIRIRGEAHTVVQAINRQIAHYAYHTGQIVYLAKHFKSSEWQNLSVPRNMSAQFNAYLGEKPAETQRENRMREARSSGTDFSLCSSAKIITD